MFSMGDPWGLTLIPPRLWGLCTLPGGAELSCLVIVAVTFRRNMAGFLTYHKRRFLSAYFEVHILLLVLYSEISAHSNYLSLGGFNVRFSVRDQHREHRASSLLVKANNICSQKIQVYTVTLRRENSLDRHRSTGYTRCHICDHESIWVWPAYYWPFSAPRI